MKKVHTSMAPSSGVLPPASSCPVPCPCSYMGFLELFLQMAEKHFMPASCRAPCATLGGPEGGGPHGGHRVTYYVFTDQLAAGPCVPLWEGQRVVVLEVPSALRWQDVSMWCMVMISCFCGQRFPHEVVDLVCVHVGMKFGNHMSMAILSPLFSTLHPSFYWAAREDLSYERRLPSQAHIPRDQGDFYYMGALFGGSVAEVH
ncbi:hypothetical protein GH733_003968 [Mirounga leonina]|nr:hypothetical protein GH733_003968 [Mirounga leonina]